VSSATLFVKFLYEIIAGENFSQHKHKRERARCFIDWFVFRFAGVEEARRKGWYNRENGLRERVYKGSWCGDES
jgi:hypothetical protein